MFNCELCNTSSKPGETAFRVVVETRETTYPFREGVHKFRKDGKKAIKDDPGGKGIEVAREVLAHRECVAAYESQT